MNPASTIASAPASVTASQIALVNEPRSSNSDQGTTRVGIPAAAARSSAFTPGRSEMTTTMRAPNPGSAAASISAWRFDPDPETSTAMSMMSSRRRPTGSYPRRPPPSASGPTEEGGRGAGRGRSSGGRAPPVAPPSAAGQCTRCSSIFACAASINRVCSSESARAMASSSPITG